MVDAPFVWKVTKNEATSHLIGTLHLRDSGCIARAAKRYIAGTDTIYFEFSQETALRDEHKILSDGQTIDNLVSADERDEILTFFRKTYEGILTEPQLEKHVSKRKLWWLELEAAAIKSDKERERYERATELMKRIYDRLLITEYAGRSLVHVGESPVEMVQQAERLIKYTESYEQKIKKRKKEQTELLDHVLFAYAREMKKKIEGLDPLDLYMALHDSVSIETQKTLLLHMIRTIEEQFPSGDNMPMSIDKIESILNPKDSHQRERIDKVHHARTALWYAKTREPLEKGNILIVAGIGHIVTEKGYVTLLQADGFTVERV